jgi:predicted ATPase
MLKALHLNNFKSAQDLNIPLGALTVLTGLNGSGKSSVLQAIALLKQSHDADQSGTHLALQGPILQLGRSQDVLFEGANTDDLAIALTTDAGRLCWQCEATIDADTLTATVEGDVSILSSALAGFQFIQADRMTPAIQYSQASSAERNKGSLGSHGEFTVDYLSRNEEKKIPAARRYPEARLKESKDIELMRSVAPTDYLPDVTAAWLQLLSPGVRPLAQLVELSDSAALRFEYKGYKDIQRDVVSHPHRPSNVGFGLTYSLPIIVACLSAARGSVLLLENPEAHLHPQGQSTLGLLLSLCAADGVQIIVETHSDHLLNAIRLAAKRKDIVADNVAVHFFTRSVETGITNCESPTLLDNGRFNDWPKGFFDEWGNALDELLED